MNIREKFYPFASTCYVVHYRIYLILSSVIKFSYETNFSEIRSCTSSLRKKEYYNEILC